MVPKQHHNKDGDSGGHIITLDVSDVWASRSKSWLVQISSMQPADLVDRILLFSEQPVGSRGGRNPTRKD